MDMIEIKKGGKYTIISNSGTDKPMKTVGEYIGYTIIGEEGAICFRVKENGKRTFLRLIPVSGIIAIEFGDEELLSTKTVSNKEDKERTTYIS